MASLGRFSSTAYGPPWNRMNGTGVTKGGTDLRDGRPAYIVAADPDVLPLGTLIRANPNPFGDPSITFLVDDIGGAIQRRRIDFYDWRGRNSQLAWGRRNVEVTTVSGNTKALGPPTIPSPFGPLPNPFHDGGPSLPDLPDIPNPLDALGELAQPIIELTKVVFGFTRGWLELVGKILSPSTWMNVGKMILGAWLILIGLRRLIEVQVS